jgi:hypothetical protein
MFSKFSRKIGNEPAPTQVQAVKGRDSKYKGRIFVYSVEDLSETDEFDELVAHFGPVDAVRRLQEYYDAKH